MNPLTYAIITAISIATATISALPGRTIILIAPEPEPIATQIPTHLDEWIIKLGNCESGNYDLAVNPKDLDGTPSLGRFQFKPSTFRFFIKKYDLFGWREWIDQDWRDNLFNGAKQEEVLRRMVTDPTVDFTHQFPACTKKIGLPPV